jgi:hypothetical protein
MSRPLLAATAIFILVFASCTNQTEPITPPKVAADSVKPAPAPVRKGTNALEFPADGYERYTPVTFIEYLKENVTSGTVLLDEAPKNWIQKQHLKELVKMLDSTEPCAGISLHGAGPNPPDNVQSCVGAEILLLIETYKQNVTYPASPSSLTFIKILQRNLRDTSKLILIPQPDQLEAAKEWVNAL